MSKTKKWLIVAGILLLLGIALSWWKDTEYGTSTQIEIGAPAKVVFNAINNLSTQKDWNAKSALDTSFHFLCVGNPVGADASCDFKSKMYGDGVVRILSVKANDSIVISEELNQGKRVNIIYKLEPIDEKNTRLSLKAKSKSGFITNLWNFIHVWKLKKHMNHQLDNLKVFVHKRYKEKVYNGYKIEEIIANQKYFIGHRASLSFENVSQYYAQNIAALYQTALQNQLTPSGMPCALFFGWDETNQKTDMAAALPTLAENNLQGTESFSLPEGRALKTVYMGEGSKSGMAHMAIDAYMLDHGLKQKIPVIEEYMTDPTQEPNPEKWVTNIYYFVSEEKQ
jgi:effector-binding domain-containing protein